MVISLTTIASYLESRNISFEIYGNRDIEVQKLLAFSPPLENALCYFVGSNPPNTFNLRNCIVICEPYTNIVLSPFNSFIFTKNPQLCFYMVSSLFERQREAFIHPQAIVVPGAKLGVNISIGAFSVVEKCEIGDNVIIEAGAKIKNGTLIGNNVIVQSNTVLGATGVMWTLDKLGNKVMCTQTGNVIIADDVFLGSNITIVKGAFENTPTIIGRNTLISHGTMIGHGVTIGSRCHFANNVTLAGSVDIGDDCFLGSSVVVRPHITIPSNTIIGAGAVVVKSYSTKGLVLIGNPAREMDRNKFTLAGIPTPYTEKDEKE